MLYFFSDIQHARPGLSNGYVEFGIENKQSVILLLNKLKTDPISNPVFTVPVVDACAKHFDQIDHYIRHGPFRLQVSDAANSDSAAFCRNWTLSEPDIANLQKKCDHDHLAETTLPANVRSVDDYFSVMHQHIRTVCLNNSVPIPSASAIRTTPFSAGTAVTTFSQFVSNARALLYAPITAKLDAVHKPIYESITNTSEDLLKQEDRVYYLMGTIVRAKHHDDAYHKLLKNLRDFEAVIVSDFKQKTLQQRYNEKIRDYFGLKELSDEGHLIQIRCRSVDLITAVNKMNSIFAIPGPDLDGRPVMYGANVNVNLISVFLQTFVLPL
jgi:hypothetical protein